MKLRCSIAHSVLIGTAIFGLIACQSGEDIPEAKATTSSADMILRATSDIQTPSPIKAATFVPNSVATWLGHIILLDDKGRLHRATTDSAETEVVALGRYADVIGILREKKAGVFLALTEQGQIKAFIQSDDEGNYSPLAVSQGNQNYARFCASAAPNGASIWAETSSGKAQQLKLDIYEDTSLTLNNAEDPPEDMNLCEADKSLDLGSNYKLKPDSASPQLTITSGNKDMSITITNGLSIGGVKKAGFVTATSANMGSVFNEGVLLIADESDGRLVLISLAYALKELEAR